MVIAFSHGFGSFRQVAYRRDQSPGGVKRGPYRGEHAEQEDHGQDQDKTQLELFPQVRQFLILGKSRLNALRQFVYPFGYGVQGMKYARTNAECVTGQVYHDPEGQPGISDGVHTDITVALQNLEQYAVVGRFRYQVVRVCRTGTDDNPLSRYHGQFIGAAPAAQAVDFKGDRRVRGPRYIFSHFLRLPEEFLHAILKAKAA